MIGYVVDAVRERYLAPQTLDTVDADRRVVLDPEVTPLDLAGTFAELALVESTTRPVAREIGGTATLLHAMTLELRVGDATVEAAGLRRDAIVTDLVLRVEADPGLGNAASPDGRQRVQRVEWAVSYANLVGDQLAAFAVLDLAVTADLDRA